MGNMEVETEIGFKVTFERSNRSTLHCFQDTGTYIMFKIGK